MKPLQALLMKLFVAGIIIFSVFILGVGLFIVSKAPVKATLNKEKGAKIGIDYKQDTFGTVKLSSGLVIHRFPVKNIGQTDLKFANLASSCACTKVYFKTATRESPKASMKGMSGVSDWVGVLKTGESGEMIMEFDPNFHGPAGVGKISRILSFETNVPDNSYVEFTLTGEVIK